MSKEQYVTCGILIDGTGAKPQQGVVLKLLDKCIADVAPGAATQIPPDAEHLDLSTFTVLPGLVECEDHLSIDFLGGMDPFGGGPAYQAIKGVHYARVVLKAGITTCRILHEMYGIDVAWKKAIDNGYMVGPRLLVACRPMVTTGSAISQIGVEVDGPTEMRKAIREQIKEGADLIKVEATGAIHYSRDPNVPSDPKESLRSFFTLDEYTLMAETAHQMSKPITAHAHGGPAARWLVEAGFDAIQHCSFFTREDLERMAERGTFLVATIGYLSPEPGSPEEELWAYEADNLRRARESCLRVYGMARELGVKVAVGTDTKHGAIPAEIRHLVDCGWSPMEAIVAATKMGAECCEILDKTGTLEPGKFADLIAVQGDPLQDLSVLEDVHLVMKEGVVEVKKGIFRDEE